MRRPRFIRKTPSWVCVRALRLSANDFIAPGETIDHIPFRLQRLRSLYERGIIAPTDSDYANELLKLTADRHERKKTVRELEEESVAECLIGSSIQPAIIKMVGGKEIQLGEFVADAYDESGLSLKEWNALEQPDRESKIQAAIDRLFAAATEEAEANRIEHTGGGWYNVHKNGKITQVQGKAAAEELLTADGV